MALALRQPARAGATATTDRVGADTRGDARVAPVSLEDVDAGRHGRGRRHDRMPGRPGAVRNDLPGQRLFAAWIHRHSGRIETADLSPARVPGCRDRRRYQLRDAAGRSSTVVDPAVVATGWPRADPG